MPSYEPIPVHPALAPYVRAMLIQQPGGDASAGAATYTVLPAPFPVLGLQYRGRLAAHRGAEERLLERSGVTGLQATVRCFVPRDDARSILVVFEPDGAAALLGCAMHELTDDHVGLSSIAPAELVRTVDERLAETTSDDERARVVQGLLLQLAARSERQPHATVRDATRRIVAAQGQQRIESLADDLSVSPRQLERLFRQYVGVGPKRFASLVQFDWARQQIGRRLPLAILAREAGYADQAHFARSFVAHAGVSPRRYGRTLGPP